MGFFPLIKLRQKSDVSASRNSSQNATIQENLKTNKTRTLNLIYSYYISLNKITKSSKTDLITKQML